MVISRETGSFLLVLSARGTLPGGMNGMSVLLYTSLDRRTLSDRKFAEDSLPPTIPPAERQVQVVPINTKAIIQAIREEIERQDHHDHVLG